ncbi:IclR family transcriptional regulator [Amycolatopsis acidiphila]|uniref:IclR family transcriptional regulator n=1 Tax=Amycolatopsis acidiphila TaxID=715473 RepID=UPI001643884F|nr:IclR family transcriptional regulator [Amycolatopsis acidiphila]UIJ57031.1 IclR family transcriptional regulator [Amycolatopsis acidiphila]GHG53749.1 transcriptional regulator [Amycolatopsis acidiphila]
MVAGEREPVARAIDVLSWLAANPKPPWSVRHVARGLRMSPTTVHRIFGIFETRGLLEKDGEGGYVAGLELYRISHSVAAQMSPVHLVRRHLEALCAECGETVLLGGYDAKRAQMMFVDVVQAPHPVQYLSKLNEWLPLHSGATGLAILAFLPELERKSIYAAGLASLTDRTLVTEDDIEAALTQVRQQGYACSHGQRTLGAVGIAAPVFDAADHVFGDVCVTIPEQRFTEPMAATVGAAVLATSKIVTEELRRAGYRRGIA